VKNGIDGTCSAYGERRGVWRVWWGNLKDIRPLGRPRRRWEDNIKIYLQEVGIRVMEWIELAQDWDRWRVLLNAVMNLRFLYNGENFLTS